MSAAPPPAAFYTPLKHPFQPEPSGDRAIGRMLLDGLRAGGYHPELASRLATWRREFDPETAGRLDRLAALIAETLIRRYRRRTADRRPRFWMTYQCYYRCPDLLGPAVATALDIPYVLVNPAVSTSSRRTAFRPWVSAARLAVRRADLVFAMSPRDVPRIASLRGARFAEARIVLLPPAVDVSRFDASHPDRESYRQKLMGRFPAANGRLCLCVAMMREVDKLDSYRLLADALRRLFLETPHRPWRLLIAGDGPARPMVEAAMASLPADRVCFLGVREPEELTALYLAADLFTFPGIGEEYGLVYLEAAAAGIPAVACRGPGPEFVLPPGGGILTEPTAEAFARGIATLLDDPDRRQRMGGAARRFVASERSVKTFQERLKEGLGRLGLI